MRIQFGEIMFDSDARELTRRGESLHLSPKAFQLLQILVEKRPSAVSKEELIEGLWPDVIVEEANLKNLVVEIRRVLGQRRIVRTVHRFGYAFGGISSPIIDQSPPAGTLIAPDHVYELHRGENIIGRAPDCEILTDSSGVSRHDAKVIVSEAGDAHLEIRSN